MKRVDSVPELRQLGAISADSILTVSGFVVANAITSERHNPFIESIVYNGSNKFTIEFIDDFNQGFPYQSFGILQDGDGKAIETVFALSSNETTVEFQKESIVSPFPAAFGFTFTITGT